MDYACAMAVSGDGQIAGDLGQAIAALTRHRAGIGPCKRPTWARGRLARSSMVAMDDGVTLSISGT